MNEWCGQSDALFPVDSTHVAEIQAAGPPEPERILFELEAYLEEYPGKAARFAETGGELAFRTAVEQFTNGLKKAAIDIDRKMLADIAVHDKAAFGSIVEQVKAKLAA